MIHKLNLKRIPFNCIKNNIKKYEIRLNSKTRRNIKVNDIICFTYQDKSILKKVKNKYVFNSLYECFEILNINLVLPKLPIKTKISAICHYSSMYSQERIERHNIVSFELF